MSKAKMFLYRNLLQDLSTLHKHMAEIHPVLLLITYEDSGISRDKGKPQEYSKLGYEVNVT